MHGQQNVKTLRMCNTHCASTLHYTCVVYLVIRSSNPQSCVPTGVKSSLFATVSSQALLIRPNRPLRDEKQLYFILRSFPKNKHPNKRLLLWSARNTKVCESCFLTLIRHWWNTINWLACNKRLLYEPQSITARWRINCEEWLIQSSGIHTRKQPICESVICKHVHTLQ